MSIAVDFLPDVEAWINAEAPPRGLTPDEYASAIIVRALLEEWEEERAGDEAFLAATGLGAGVASQRGEAGSRDGEQRLLSARWLRHHGNAFFRGRWVALQGAELIGAAPTLQELRERVGKSAEVLIVKVPPGGFVPGDGE